MKWYKHEANASFSANVQELLYAYGTEGYAVYFHSLALISRDIEEHNCSFALTHSPRMIAKNLNILGTEEQTGIERVEEILEYLVDRNMFKKEDGYYKCPHLVNTIDTSMTSNMELRKVIKQMKGHGDSQEQNLYSHQE